jgi:hypothetical protein
VRRLRILTYSQSTLRFLAGARLVLLRLATLLSTV